MNSIIQDKKECYFCKSQVALQKHHCIFGSSRKNADKYNLWVWLCLECHLGTFGVHGIKGLERKKKLQEVAQMKFESIYSHELWMKVFRKNYL